MRFNITHVKAGEAPDTGDRVFIDLDRGGFYSWKGVVFVEGSAIYGGSPPEFRTEHEAQVEAVAWATRQGVTNLFVEADATEGQAAQLNLLAGRHR